MLDACGELGNRYGSMVGLTNFRQAGCSCVREYCACFRCLFSNLVAHGCSRGRVSAFPISMGLGVGNCGLRDCDNSPINSVRTHGMALGHCTSGKNRYQFHSWPLRALLGSRILVCLCMASTSRRLATAVSTSTMGVCFLHCEPSNVDFWGVAQRWDHRQWCGSGNV